MINEIPSLESFTNKEAFNIELMFPNKNTVIHLGKVTSGLILETASDTFNKEGLYSSEIFNTVGSKERNVTFGYIDLFVEVIHPMLYEQIISLSALYKKIIYGKTYAIWDDKEKDFIISDQDDGETGYDFFVKNIKNIKWKRNDSKERDFKIDLIEKYIKEDKITYNKLLVLPAGLREYEEDKNGRVVEDEINDLYRGCLNVAKMLENMSLDKEELPMVNNIVLKLQSNINTLYTYLISLLDGKKKFINGNWTSRGIDNATRNVISSLPTNVNDLSNDNNRNMNDTICGLFQYIKASEPNTIYNVNNMFLSNIFSETSNMSKLIDMKTLSTINVEISSKERDRWVTDDGINNTMNKLVDDTIKNSPIIIDGHYLGLIYDDKDTIVYITDTQLMGELDKTKLRPITYGELFYIAIYDNINRLPCLLTRYPITGQGSIYPSNVKVDTTSKNREVSYYINTIEGIPKIIHNYPITTKSWLGSLSPNYTKLAGLGGDFDGRVL